jgi:crotonobetainyl-CoA:carnitine CoA-transferase CaiB-like acyl-CoA transferase
MNAPLAGIRVFDLTRILAGPTCTQLLGDLGAEVIKIEQPGKGDDTRGWGPPYVKDAQSRETTESAYYLSANRNKRSLSLDLSRPEGQEIARSLIARSDVLVENFKVGGLARYGLGYADLAPDFPELIYCSITGFGQSGPYAPRAGYDYLAQGMGGIMSLTGEPEGTPMKVGIGIADIMCGMYAAVAILAALRHREAGGGGQQIDLALLDSQVAWLSYEGLNYLVSGEVPERRGNEHPNIVPYRVMPAADGHFILAVGNDAQFARFADFAGAPELARDPRYRTNSARLGNRRELYDRLEDLTRTKTCREWLEGLEALGVPSGAVNRLDKVFADPQVQARGMQIAMPREGVADGEIPLIANPIRFSETAIEYRHPPPKAGEQSNEILDEVLGLSPAEIAKLASKGII